MTASPEVLQTTRTIREGPDPVSRTDVLFPAGALLVERPVPRALVRRARTRPHDRHGPVAQLLIASSPLSLILLTYALGGWVNATIDLARPLSTVNRLGFGLHQTAAASLDRHVFGSVPTVWLQRHLVDGSTHWYDAVAAVVYATHFVAIPLLTALVWFCWRERYRAWIVSVLAFIVVGVAGYVLFPASPPWMAARAGLVEPVARISGIGWPYLHLGSIGQLVGAGQAASNPVAAMPSLHAGGAMLVVLFLRPIVRPRWRPALIAYPLSMGLTLVYTGEHYTVDVVAGWLTAVIAAAVGAIAEHGLLRALRRIAANPLGAVRCIMRRLSDTAHRLLLTDVGPSARTSRRTHR